jgi:hypothetical protein
MKAVKLIMVLILVSVVSVNATDIEGIKVLSSKLDIVYLKVPMDMVGGILTVYDDHGATVFDQSVTNKKVLVDFFEAKPGDYVIHIERCGHVEEVKYHKG